MKFLRMADTDLLRVQYDTSTVVTNIKVGAVSLWRRITFNLTSVQHKTNLATIQLLHEIPVKVSVLYTEQVGILQLHENGQCNQKGRTGYWAV
jgi:hypothetical protein